MLRHNFAAALRQLWRNRLATALNLAGLAIGLGCFVFADGTASFLSGRGAATQYQNIFLTTERSVDPGQSLPPNPSTSVLLAPPLRAELPAGYRVGRVMPVGETGVHADAAKMFLQVYYADPDVLRMFALPSAGADALDAPHSVVLTERTARRLFGNRQAIGQVVTIDGVDATVSAISDPPAGASPYQFVGTDFDILASMDIYEKINPAMMNPNDPTNWFKFFASTYIEAPAASHETVAGLDSRLATFGDRHVTGGTSHAYFGVAPGYSILGTMADLAVRSDVTGLTAGAILDLLGIVILATAVANYINLATAQVLGRTREVRIRRILGATSLDLLRQHAIETCLIVAVACLALTIALLVTLPVLGAQVGAELHLALMDRLFWLHVAVAVAATVLVAGLYPAALFATLPAAGALQKRRWQSWLGAGLTCLQFASAAALLIFTLVARDQDRTMRQVGEPQGVDPVVAIESDPGTNLASLRAALQTIPEVRAVSSALYVPWSANVSWDNLHRDVAGAPSLSSVVNSVGENYFPTMGMKLLAGRELSPLRGGDQPPPDNGAIATRDINVVIDRDLAAQLGWRDPAAAVGEPLMVPDTGRLRVVGVVENHPTNMIVFGIHGNLYWSANHDAKVTLVRLDGGRVQSGLAAIDAAWNDAAPLAPLKRAFVADLFDQGFRELSEVTGTITALVVPAFLVALAGLAGMTIEVTRGSLREIAIRKMLGASTWDAARLLLWRFAKPLLIANLIAWPLALAGAKGYLSLFTVRTELTVWPFLGGLLGTLAVAALTVAGETARTARSSPAEVLRAE